MPILILHWNLSHQYQVEWNVKRELAKVNYVIHTDAVKAHLIPDELTKRQISFIYANEADLLNVALFGKTAKEFKDTKKSPRVSSQSTPSQDFPIYICPLP